MLKGVIKTDPDWRAGFMAQHWKAAHHRAPGRRALHGNHKLDECTLGSNEFGRRGAFGPCADAIDLLAYLLSRSILILMIYFFRLTSLGAAPASFNLDLWRILEPVSSVRPSAGEGSVRINPITMYLLPSPRLPVCAAVAPRCKSKEYLRRVMASSRAGAICFPCFSRCFSNWINGRQAGCIQRGLCFSARHGVQTYGLGSSDWMVAT